MKLLLLLGTLVPALLAVVLLIQTARVRAHVMAELKQLKWIEKQYSDALGYLRSGQAAQILTGLQLIGAFNDSDARNKSLPDVMKLIDHDEPRVSRMARSVLAKVVNEVADEVPVSGTDSAGKPENA
ncbi:MAG: hypothetical protein M3O15_03400 [Acidobacteriota bacterium]|nr:hypothetical protein [Acidobacteriota bacterium]